MTESEALFQAILADPGDDGIRLVYADYLEEHGEAERAEFIRVQCYLASLASDDPRRQKLHEREWALLQKHCQPWLAPLRPVLDRQPSFFARLRQFLSGPDPAWRWDWTYAVQFRRGFVESLSLSAADFPALAPALFAAAPLLRDLSLGCHAPGDMAPLFHSPSLARLEGLYLTGEGLGPQGIELLVDCPHLKHLRELYLRINPLTIDCLTILATSKLMSQLTSLTLYLVQPEDAEGTVVRDSIRALAESPMCHSLQTLNLRFNLTGDAGVGALAHSPYLSRLTKLDLGCNRITDTGAAALAASPYLSALRVLELEGNLIADAGARALAASTTLARLTRLGLRGNPIGPAGAIPLGARFGNRVQLRSDEED
jgi:uncharacterized protein (TIGR02996 family)